MPLAATTVSIAAGVSLAFEVLLTRLFSLLFEYHYVFVATSLAICGLGLGGAGGAWLLARPARVGRFLRPSRLLIALALTLVLDSLLFSLVPWAGAVYLQAALALPPFILVGLLLSTLFAARAADSARLYAADLLGAAVGTTAVLGLIVWSGVFTAILWLAVLAALPALLLSAADGDRPAQRTAAGVAGIGLLLALAGQFFHVPSFNPATLVGAPPDKTLVGVLQNPQMQAHITDTVWGPFARLDLVETSDPDTKLLFTDGGAGSYMIRFDGDYSKVADLQQNPDYLPFTVAPPTSTLILGAGAGKDVLLALMAGSQQVTAVELNQDSVDLTRRYGAYNGQILDRPGVTTVVSDGRSFVESTQQHYDLIYLNLVYSQAAGHEGSALAESYVFTVEALRAYWQHLKPGGRIGIVTHNGFEGSRVLLTAIAALQAEGLDTRQALDRVILHQQVSQNPDSATSVLLVTKNALDETQLSAQIGVADKLGMRQMYVPVLFELPLRDLVKGVATLDTFAHNGEYNLVPTHDEQPYFYQLQWGLPAAIVVLLILTGLGGLIYLTLVVRLNWRAGARPAVALALFFVLLGAAYMLAMLPLVQRFYLLVGNPTLALVITLEGLLFGAGFGSLFSSRLHGNLKRPVTLALAGALVLLVAYAVLYPLLGPALLQTPLLVRLGAILLMTLPLGLLIGLPFPSGLRLAGAWTPRAVPALWGLNAIAAVLGSVLAAAVAMLLGFEAVLLLAACCYAAAAVLLRGVRT